MPQGPRARPPAGGAVRGRDGARSALVGGGSARLSAGQPGAWNYLAKLNYPITFASPPMYRLAVSLDLWGLQRGDKPVRAAR